METFISIVFVIIVTGILIYFYTEDKKIKMHYLHKEIGYSSQCSLERTQIEIRQKGLDGYDFLKFNLSEALIVQPKINISN